MELFRRHATGCTIILFLLAVLGLSLAPVPSELKPLDWFEQPEPFEVFVKSVFKRPHSVPKRGDAAADDWGLANHESSPPEEDDAPKPEVAALPVRAEHAPWSPPKRPRLDQYRDKLHLEAKPIDDPCVESTSSGCSRHSLDRFFDVLSRARDGEAGAVARVVHYGDSIIASDHITDMVRQRLQERFGSAGKGFLLITRYNPRQRRLRTGDGSEGWKAEHIAQGTLADRYFGYAGASFIAERAGVKTTFGELGASRFVDVYFLAQPKGGAFEAFADGMSVQVIDASAKGTAPEASFASFELPEGTKSLELRAKDAGVRLFGVSLEANVPGVIYESIGVPGTSSETWLYPDEAGFSLQLAHRKPSLIVTMLGGNDARSLHQKRRTIDVIETKTREFLARVRKSAPNADCLVISPLDAVEAKASGEMRSRPEVPQLMDVQRKLARELGCGFWDMYQSMGGAGSLARWYEANLINPDLIHPRAVGGDLLGELLAEALMKAYDDRKKDEADVARAVP